MIKIIILKHIGNYQKDDVTVLDDEKAKEYINKGYAKKYENKMMTSR